MTCLAPTMTLIKFNQSLIKSNVKTRQTTSCNNWNAHPKKVVRQSKDTWVLTATRTCALARSKSQTASAKSSFTPGCAKCQTMFTSGSFTAGKPKYSVVASKLSWAFSTFQGRVSLKIGKRLRCSGTYCESSCRGLSSLPTSLTRPIPAKSN